MSPPVHNPEIEQRLRRTFPFLEQAQRDFRRRFMESVSLAHLASGASICHEGVECSHLALVLSGTARIYKLGESGRELTLYRVGPGESCILTASCILSHTPFPAFAVCEHPIEAAMVPTSRVQAWMEESAAWRNYVFGLVAHRLGDLIHVVEEVVFRRMDQRIAGHLLQYAGDSTTLHTTHQAIAADLGTSREVVSRILKDLESEGLIEVARGTIILCDPAALKRKAQTPT